MKQYSLRIRLLAGALIVFECLILVGALGYILYAKYRERFIGISTTRISRDNIVASSSGDLKYFYEWEANQTITHKRTWLPGDVTATTNGDGLLGSRDYPVNKPEETFRIITIGDSFTEGLYVEPYFTYPNSLERALNESQPCQENIHYEVLNLGVGGYDIEYAAHRLETRGIKYQPDLIIWLLKDDDFIERTEIDMEKTSEYATYVTERLDGDIERFDIYQKYAADIDRGDKGLFETIHDLLVRQQIDTEAHKEYFLLQEKAIRRIVAVSPTPVVMMTFEQTDARFKARMKLWTKQYDNLFLYDGIPHLTPGAETFEPYDGHPNKSGYTVIADTIAKSLIGHGHLCRIL